MADHWQVCDSVIPLTIMEHGQQQAPQAKGRDRCITSRSWLSKKPISKARMGPQHWRVQQSVSSFAVKKSCPIEFFKTYLLFISHPESTGRVLNINMVTFSFTQWYTSHIQDNMDFYLLPPPKKIVINITWSENKYYKGYNTLIQNIFLKIGKIRVTELFSYLY